MMIFDNWIRVSPGDTRQVRPFPWPIRCVASTHLQFHGSHLLAVDWCVLRSCKTARLSRKQRFLTNQLADWYRRLPRPVGTLGGPARWFLAPGGVFIRTQHGQILVGGCRWNLQWLWCSSGEPVQLPNESESQQLCWYMLHSVLGDHRRALAV